MNPGHGKVQDVVVLAEPVCRWQTLTAEEPRVRKHVELKEEKVGSLDWAFLMTRISKRKAGGYGK